MLPELKSIQDYLATDTRRQICFFDVNSNGKLTEKLNHKSILSKAENIQEYLKKIAINSNISSVKIKFYAPNGSTTKLDTKKPETIVNFNSETQVNSGNDVGRNVQNFNSVQPASTYQKNNNSFNTVGMNGADIINWQKREIDKLENKVKELEQTDRQLRDELLKTKTDLSTADKIRELDLKILESDRKPKIDPAIVNAVITNLPTFFSALASGGNVQQAAAQGMNGLENISKEKNNLINSIAKENCTDDYVAVLNTVYALIRSNKDFYPKLAELVNNFN